MKVFIVLAHPEPKSLTHSLHKVLVKELEKEGHEIKVSDLYKMKWNPVLDTYDAPVERPDDRFVIARDHKLAYENHVLPEDVQKEQEKVDWADLVIFQYPLWWFSAPAILKGWVERVYASGYAYSRGYNSKTPNGERYGDGIFVGKKGMIISTNGSKESYFSARGINGPIDDVLFHQTHGWFFYPGFTVLPTLALYSANHLSDENYEKLAEAVRERARALPTLEPIKFRKQNGGDYDNATLELKPGYERPGTSGCGLHIA